MDQFAVIDIGSNAVRLYLARLNGSEKKYTIYDKIRIPMRLGSFVFHHDSNIQAELFNYAENVFMAVAKTLKKQKIKHLKAVATSALRDYSDSDKLCAFIAEKTGIKIEVISGQREADLIYQAINHSFKFSSKKKYLLFDIGGGSIELTSIENGERGQSRSFNLGTVRFMEAKKEKSSKELQVWLDKKIGETHQFLKKEFSKEGFLTVLGTGGNFNRLPKVYQQIKGKKLEALSLSDLSLIHDTLFQCSYLDRISLFDMRPDRADVITYAIELIILVLSYFDEIELINPRVGLGEGLFEEILSQNADQFTFPDIAVN